MGAQQVLRAVVCVAVTAASISVEAAPRKERVAVIDLGGQGSGSDPGVQQRLQAAIVAAGLEPVIGDGVDGALAGGNVDRDAIALAAQLAAAERSFGQLDCKSTVASAQAALPILAARQAAAMAVPELPRAAAYLLLCADRAGDPDAAMRAARYVRAIGTPLDVAAALLAKYPEVDATGSLPVEVDVTTDAPGAQLWIDFAAGPTAPAHLALTPTEHVIAAAAGARRGSLIGTPIASQPKLVVSMPDQAGEWSAVAARVASWHGAVPSPDELAWVLAKVHARVALVRHGDTVEVWGHAGLAEPVRRLGGDDGVRSLAEADKASSLVADRVDAWNEHAPDPDRPLLVEDVRDRAAKAGGHQGAHWWVYAAIGVAAVAAALVVTAHYEDGDTQRVELHFP